MAAREDLYPGATLQRRDGAQITVLAAGVSWAGKRNGVRFRYETGVCRGQERTLPASSLRSYQPVAAISARDRRIADLDGQLTRLAELIGDANAHSQVLAARMDAGEPCVQLTVTERGFAQLMRMLDPQQGAGSLETLAGLHRPAQ